MKEEDLYEPIPSSAVGAIQAFVPGFPESFGVFKGEDGFLHKTPERMAIEAEGKDWFDVYPGGKK